MIDLITHDKLNVGVFDCDAVTKNSNHVKEKVKATSTSIKDNIQHIGVLVRLICGT